MEHEEVKHSVPIGVCMLLNCAVHACEDGNLNEARHIIYVVPLCARRQVRFLSSSRVSRCTLRASKSPLRLSFSILSSAHHAPLPLQMADTLILQIDGAICHRMHAATRMFHVKIIACVLTWLYNSRLAWRRCTQKALKRSSAGHLDSWISASYPPSNHFVALSF